MRSQQSDLIYFIYFKKVYDVEIHAWPTISKGGEIGCTSDAVASYWPPFFSLLQQIYNIIYYTNFLRPVGQV